MVKLKLSGDGIAVKGLMCVNRDGFDPAPLIQAAIGNAAKDSKFNARWLPYGPDFTAVVEREKLIRGRVTDHEGKSRVGVRVSVTRTTRTELTDHWYWHEATTDRDGKYEIRGLRKYPAYTVDVDGDPKSGQLPLQVSSQDTAWYEPITLDAKSARGVVVSGRVTNKATGQPVPGTVDADVMPDNPFVVKYPTLLESSHSVMRTRTDADGGFRLVVLPGRVLVMFRPDEGRTEYRPPQPDPDHATLFHPSADGVLVYDSYAGGRGIVQGNWCKVLETKPTDTEVAVNVELEPATITLVNVVDADGKPVIGAKATGLTHSGFDRSTDVPGRDTLTVFNLEGKKERMLAVIHVKRKLVGTLTLTADAKNPVMKLGIGGSVTGKAVGADGKPLAGLTVELTYPRREARAASDLLKKAESIITDANGEFRIDTLFPGQEFQLSFSRGKKQYGPGQAKAPKHTLAKHGDTLKLGDLTLDAAKDGD